MGRKRSLKEGNVWLQSWERPAYYLDLYRVWPRAILLGYSWMVWTMSAWYMALKEPSGAQSAFVGAVYGVAGLITNFYMQNGVDWNALRAMKQGNPGALTAGQAKSG
jgi:hypothetical protein